ncbi:MAG: TonB C-terminal domain-containing protein [Candidatus Obscuribacterales bacterium]|nr:TonB C-terminal domain-containing protein [Candidatus Obscuribacterales bacterium]
MATMNGKRIGLAAGIILGILCSFSSLTEAKQAQDKPTIRDKWALVIGINRFNDTTIPGLPLAQKSAADVARALKDPDAGRFAADHIILLNGTNATKAGIDQTLEQWLYKKALPNDLVFLYFASRISQTAAGEPVICSNDTKMSDLKNSGLDLVQTIKTIKQRTGSDDILCLLDCNPAGKIENGKDLKWLASTSGATIMSANALYEQSFDDKQSLSSRFSHYFSEALRGSQGNLPFFMIGEYIYQKIQEQKAQDGQEQKPSMVLSKPDSQTAAIIIGMPIKNPNSNSGISIGHPIDQLAMTRPDLAGAIPAPIKSAPPPKSASEMEDDEDAHIDHNLDFSSYMTKMKQDIQKKWQPPKGFESRKVTTVFTITNTGAIVNPEVSVSSGNQEMDKSALIALQAASPLDPLPKGSPRSVDIKYVFDWKSSVKY